MALDTQAGESQTQNVQLKGAAVSVKPNTARQLNLQPLEIAKSKTLWEKKNLDS